MSLKSSEPKNAHQKQKSISWHEQDEDGSISKQSITKEAVEIREDSSIQRFSEFQASLVGDIAKQTELLEIE